MEKNDNGSEKQTIYYFHKISISCYQDITTLRKIIQHEEIKIRPIFLKDRKPIPYQASIEIVAPTEMCLHYLAEIENDLRQCKISYIELARDTFFPSFPTADLVVRNIAKTLRKKYSGGNKYDGSKKEKQPGKGLFGDYTYYFGTVTPKEEEKINDNEKIDFDITGAFKFAMYPKDSPINELPCAHSEWRIVHAHNIRKKTGIGTIKDLLTVNKAEAFENLADKYLTHSDINLYKLGMWILNKNRCKKPSKTIQRLAGMQGRYFYDFYRIRTANDLISFFMLIKKKIKSKVGRKSDSEQRILLVNYNRFLEKKSVSGFL